MITVNNILDFLKQKYPLDTACDFDNVGLLVGNGDACVSKAVVCLDCDINTVNYAKSVNANLIVTHHPVIFNGLKSVTVGSVVYELLNSGISVISMHTNLDIAQGGVTEQLCSALQLNNVTPFVAHDGFLIRSADCKIKNADELANHIKKQLGTAVRYADSGRAINKVLVCSGSGGDFLQDVIENNYDALIAADIKHNIFIDAINCGVTVFDAGHYQTENIITDALKKTLSDNFGTLEFNVFYNSKIKYC